MVKILKQMRKNTKMTEVLKNIFMFLLGLVTGLIGFVIGLFLGSYLLYLILSEGWL